MRESGKDGKLCVDILLSKTVSKNATICFPSSLFSRFHILRFLLTSSTTFVDNSRCSRTNETGVQSFIRTLSLVCRRRAPWRQTEAVVH